jgi:hypothetical protein
MHFSGTSTRVNFSFDGKVRQEQVVSIATELLGPLRARLGYEQHLAETQM